MKKKSFCFNSSFIDLDMLTTDSSSWLEVELEKSNFADERLNKRFVKLAQSVWQGLGNSIPYACQDWENTKAAYRFFSNPHVTEKEILGGHFNSTEARFNKTTGTILILQDTTEFSYQRERPDLIGITKKLPKNKDITINPKSYTKCGLLMHSSLAVTTQGLPLGLAAIKFWTRKKFKGCNALKGKINTTRIPIDKKESFRWLENLKQSTTLLKQPSRCVHIGDRESDIYELYCLTQELGTHFVVRTCADRLSGDGSHTVSDVMSESNVKKLHQFEVRDKKGNISLAVLNIKYRRIKVLPPTDKKKKYPALWLTVIHAVEKNKPKGRERIVWKLLTDLPIKNEKDAIEKLNWYAMRWKIETYHKILKSGCKAESSKLRTANRLVNLISIFCILSWRIFWMTMINRCYPKTDPNIAFTDEEINLLDKLMRNSVKTKKNNKTLSDYLVKIAKLGGYLARASDSPAGNTVMWCGLSRLTDINFGFNMAIEVMGN